jgi:hypothetical protein
MTIQRLFEPDHPDALERVAEILSGLLMEAPNKRAESSDPDGAAGQVATCVSEPAR